MVGMIYFVLLLGIIVTVHELGHFLVAKAFGVYCAEFAIGMGPKLFSIQGKETLYTIRLLPIGGFVQMAGEPGTALEGECTIDVPFERTIKGISRFKQICIMLAGIVMNFVLAFVLFFGVFLSEGTSEPVSEAYIGTISPDSPAQEAGIQSGDLVLSIEYEDGTVSTIETFDDISTTNVGFEQQTRTYVVQRGEDVLRLDVTPVYFEEYDRYMIGIGQAIKSVPISIGEAVGYSVEAMVEGSTLIVDSLMQLFRGNNLDQLSGPVGIYTVTSQQAALGLANYVWLVAVLSLNIGIFNALPLPILDGGRAILITIEAIIGKPINKKIESGLMVAGAMMMLALFVFATLQDILRLFG